MCGFIGLLKAEPKWLDTTEREEFEKRNNIIQHRGPDDDGYYEDEHIILGFRRLSIIDVECGHQPITYDDDRYWMVFNGEIYNYLELKESLKEQGMTFSTDSDTEVIIAMFAKKGVDTFSELRGMFSLLIWDKEEQCLYGARDMFGIKPFFYKDSDEGLYFASEKKSLLAETEQMDQEAMQHYFTYQYVPEPMSMNKNISKLEPGSYFIKEKDRPLASYHYFQPGFNVQHYENKDWIERIQSTLDQSVAMHMRSDVPVGSFLSGGIDSSIIVALAKRYHPNIKTFSVGFEQNGYSEVDIAKETADRLGVENYSYIISPEEYVAKLPKIIWHLDDPLADPACVPLYFVAREAKTHVKVVLSGEGADELFGGYNIYRESESLRIFESIPAPVKGLLARVANVLPEGVKGKSFLERGTTPLRKRYIGNAKMFEEAEKQKLLRNYLEENYYQKVTAPFYDQIEHDHPVHQMQYIDMQTWLRGDILLKADKMTMAHSLELRVPFLDKEVFKVASEIPVSKKIANGTTKHILREAASGIVPDHVLNRKKLGFPVPIRHWLKNELYEWAKNLIQESVTDHLLEKNVIFNLLDEHCKGKKDNSRKLWTVLMFMLWHQIYIEKKYDISELQEDKTESKLVHN
ncbi:asparagine synthase (glutamine-hydrolysing) [Gracilibacillus orientalis]|uniref:asparagine synthase (glutamine-hydrolyzing) n=1 Tax=Gracilibacillus orientalis TaxID=334253 RepID=A0A1I4R846_9BACI|nr:asparagine synthase (glutamine-hydrolyzing) [Gracilibacillus orientalis]SFM48427.1 asparagine synthase (glutamine-hydrolysing) [Gracilibacillus orientalis]